MPAFFASATGALSRSGPIFALVPAALNVWQAPQPAEMKIAFPFAAGAGAADAVVGAAFAVVVGDAEALVVVTVTVFVVPWLLVSWPIAQPMRPAGKRSTANRIQTRTSPAIATTRPAVRTFSGAYTASASAPVSDTTTKVQRCLFCELPLSRPASRMRVTASSATGRSA